MSTLFNNETPRMLPKVALNKTSFLSIVSPLVKLDIIKEGEGRKCRNAHKLDLSNSIYEKIEED
jgi:hypothetical protein